MQSNFKNDYLGQLIVEKYKNNANFALELNKRGIKKGEDSVKKWRQGNSVPKVIELPVIAEALDIFVNDLFSNHETNTIIKKKLGNNYHDSIIMIDKLDIRAGAGSGGYVLDQSKEDNKITLDSKLLQYGLDPKNLRFIEVIGSSMEPKYKEGENILIDMLNGRYGYAKIAGTYIIRVCDLIYIKNVEFLPNNRVRLISINKDYSDILPHEEGCEYEILGKVCGVFRIKKGFIFDNQGLS